MLCLITQKAVTPNQSWKIAIAIPVPVTLHTLLMTNGQIDLKMYS
jgi:hypothetical protein